MIIYDVDDSKSLDGIQDIHCLFCGSRIVDPDNGGSFGDCEHLRLVCSSETWEDPDISKEDFFKDFDYEEDEHFDYLKEKLDDTYLMLLTFSPAPSGLEYYHIFRQFPT